MIRTVAFYAAVWLTAVLLAAALCECVRGGCPYRSDVPVEIRR